MRTTGTLTKTTLLATLMLTLTSVAHAKSAYVAYIPNGNVKTCNNCHPNGNTAALTLFGEDALTQSGKPSTDWWPALQDLDSDQDGQTNGQELGDPCGDWLIGLDPPRTTSISNPGDAASVSADPDTPSCGGGGAGGGTTGTTTSQGGGTGTTTSSTTTGAGASSGNNGEGSGVPFSTGAGKADPPLSVKGSCSTAPPGESGGALGLLATIAFFLMARSRRNAHR